MTALEIFRKVSLVEGVSAILLFLVAMPLKYLANMPQAVKVVGMIHGVLFLVFLLALLFVSIKDKWPIGKTLLGFVAGNLPFGAFWFEHRLRKESESA